MYVCEMSTNIHLLNVTNNEIRIVEIDKWLDRRATTNHHVAMCIHALFRKDKSIDHAPHDMEKKKTNKD